VATGWGRSTWGDGPFGATAVSVAVTGLAGTTTLGNESSVTGDANVVETGVVGTSALNSVAGFAIQGVSGTASTVGLGDETVTGDANVFPTNVIGTSALGNLGLVTVNILPVTLGAATGQVGNETVQADANVFPTGVLTETDLGKVFVWGQIVPGQTPDWTAISSPQTPNWKQVA